MAVSVASPETTDTVLTLENVCDGPRDREAVCAVECFEAGDQGTCFDTIDSLVGVPADKYLPQEICSVDLELAEGQRKVSDLCSPNGKTLEVLFRHKCLRLQCLRTKAARTATQSCPLFYQYFHLEHFTHS